MHLNLDDQIYEVEKRIALRKADLEFGSRAAGRRALKGLGSPAALITAAAVGFAAGGCGRKRKRNGNHHHNGNGAVSETGLGSLLMTGATWFIKAQYGSPAGLARAVLGKIQARKNADPRLR